MNGDVVTHAGLLLALLPQSVQFFVQGFDFLLECPFDVAPNVVIVFHHRWRRGRQIAGLLFTRLPFEVLQHLPGIPFHVLRLFPQIVGDVRHLRRLQMLRRSPHVFDFLQRVFQLFERRLRSISRRAGVTHFRRQQFFDLANVEPDIDEFFVRRVGRPHFPMSRLQLFQPGMQVFQFVLPGLGGFSRFRLARPLFFDAALDHHRFLAQFTGLFDEPLCLGFFPAFHQLGGVPFQLTGSFAQFVCVIGKDEISARQATCQQSPTQPTCHESALP